MEKTIGLVLKNTAYSETSLISKIYTKDFGMQSFMVRGAKSKKSKKSSLLQALNIVELVYKPNPSTDLHNPREINLVQPYQNLHLDFVKTSIAIFLTEVLYQALKGENKNPELFNYVHKGIQVLDLGEKVQNFHLVFMLHLCKYLGFFPGKEGLSFFEKQSAYKIKELLGMNFDSAMAVKITHDEKKELIRSVLRFYQYNVSGFGEIKSLEVLETIFAN